MAIGHALVSLVACATLAACLPAPSPAFGPVRDERRLGAPRHTLAELRFENVVRQDLDYSCGGAALATLLTHYFHDPVTEKEILDLFDERLVEAERAERRATGFSLLDLKRAANTLGYDAAGYRLTLEQLASLSVPVIVHVVPGGYEHFAVLRDVIGDRVLLADPSRGNLRMSVARFEDEWSGVAFALGGDRSTDIGGHRLSPSEMRDVLPDRLRTYRQLDVDERLVGSPIPLPPARVR